MFGGTANSYADSNICVEVNWNQTRFSGGMPTRDNSSVTVVGWEL